MFQLVRILPSPHPLLLQVTTTVQLGRHDGASSWEKHQKDVEGPSLGVSDSWFAFSLVEVELCASYSFMTGLVLLPVSLTNQKPGT